MQNQQLNPCELAAIGAGCYVQIESKQHEYWVEIIRRDDEELTGKIHRELNGNPPQNSKNYACFKLSSINKLGCDNYCFC